MKFSSHRKALVQSLLWGAVFAVLPLSRSQAQTPAPEKTPKAEPQKAEEAYLAGTRLLGQRDLAAAEKQFKRATTLDPQRQDYLVALNVTRDHEVGELLQAAAKARLVSDTAKADALLAQARKIDPDNDLVREHSIDTAEQAAPPPNATEIRRNKEIALAPPIEIDPAPGMQSLHLRGDNTQVVTQAAAAYGIHAVIDSSVTAQPIRFDLDDVTYAQAMPILLRMNHLFSVAVAPKTLLVAKDTLENREKFERQIEETIYIPGSTTEQLNELTNIVKNVFDVKQIATSPGAGTLLIRAPEPTLKALNYTLADLLDGGSEVVLEIKLLSIDKSITRNIGASTPTSVGAISVTAEAQSLVNANQSIIGQAISQGAFVPTGNYTTDIITEAAYLVLSGLATDAKLSNLFAIAGHGLTLTGFYLGSGATYNLALNSSDARALDDITIRMGDRQTATLKVGQKYPITTATYSSGISSTTSSALAGVSINGQSAASLLAQYTGGSSTATIPQVQYEDLGLTLKTTPYVMKSGLIKLSIDLKLEALTGESNDNIPILTNSNFVSDITVPDGSTAVMLSEMSNTQSASVSGIPGLASLPGFQDTLADTLKETDSSELILLVTPHLVRRRPSSIASRRVPFASSVPVDN
jgi:general secretion pathway protein D